MDTLNYIILVPMVYLSFSVFFIGMAYQVVRVFKKPAMAMQLGLYPKKKNRWAATLFDTFFMPTVLRAKPVFWFFLMGFHFCIFLLLVGHMELLYPAAIFQMIPHEIFIGKGMVGVFLLIALIFFLFRRITPEAKHLSVFEDYLLLILLMLTVILGSEMDWARTWFDFQEMTTDDYQSYLISLIRFRPDISDVTYSGHSFMLVFHVFFANLFLLYFPFSKMMHAIFTVPLNKIRRG